MRQKPHRNPTRGVRTQQLLEALRRNIDIIVIAAKCAEGYHFMPKCLNGEDIEGYNRLKNGPNLFEFLLFN